MRVAAVVLISLALGAACARSSSAPATQPGTTVAPAGPTQVLPIDPKSVRIDHGKRKVEYRPGRDVKRARYVTYHFDYREFLRFVKAGQPVTLRVQVLEDATRVVRPPPDQSSPLGGFRIRHLTCRILGRATP